MRVVEESFDHLFESLHAEQDSAGDGSAAFLLDGSGLTLEPTPELLKAYPPARNQHGASHWPSCGGGGAQCENGLGQPAGIWTA